MTKMQKVQQHLTSIQKTTIKGEIKKEISLPTGLKIAKDLPRCNVHTSQSINDAFSTLTLKDKPRLNYSSKLRKEVQIFDERLSHIPPLYLKSKLSQKSIRKSSIQKESPNVKLVGAI